MAIRKYLLMRWVSKVAKFGTENYLYHPKVFSEFLSFLSYFLPATQAKIITSSTLANLAANLDWNCSFQELFVRYSYHATLHDLYMLIIHHGFPINHIDYFQDQLTRTVYK